MVSTALDGMHGRSQEFVLEGALLLRRALLTLEWPLYASRARFWVEKKKFGAFFWLKMYFEHIGAIYCRTLSLPGYAYAGCGGRVGT